MLYYFKCEKIHLTGKEQSITQLNVTNSCYVLDQQRNYI